MPVIGIRCMADGEFKSFQECLDAHENYTCHCNALPFAIKLIRDNAKGRENAGISASTLTSCPRENILAKKYDYYQNIEDGWIMGEGTLTHAMIEADEEPDFIVKEKRIYRYIDHMGQKVRISGQMDRVDTKHKRLIDYKRKETVPNAPDVSHEFQFNIYVWLLADGFDITNDEPFALPIEAGGMHYISRKKTNPFKKIAYPIWSKAKVEREIRKRLTPLLEYEKTGILPECNPYQSYGKNWVCGCKKIEEQLESMGTTVE